MTAKYVTCRMTNRLGNRCTGEAVDPNAEIKICTRHLAQAQRLIFDALRKARAADRT